MTILLPSSRAGCAAFTLVEMIATVTILGIIGAATLPVVEAAGSLYAESASMSRRVERASFAMDRAARLLRAIDLNDDGSGLALASVTEAAIVCENGDAIHLEARELILGVDGREASICDGVDEFEVMAFAADGITRAESEPSRTRRILLRLVVDGVEIRTAVFPRAAMGVQQ